MEKLLELADIALLPAITNNGYSPDEYDFGLQDTDRTVSLPIFTSPIDSIIGASNYRDFEKQGIKPVLPKSLPVEQRLEACQYCFTAFTKKEVEEHFLSHGKRSSQYQFHVCIDHINGHDASLLQLAQKLKQLYSTQINLMIGNIANSKVYIDYCKAGVDYVRVGMSTGSIAEPEKYGFYTPLASILIEIAGLRNTACIGLKLTKVIADGGIETAADVLKCLALGADFVMIGRGFVRLVEASGNLCRKVKTPEGNYTLETVSPDIIKTGTLKELGLRRLYSGVTEKTKFCDTKAEWVEVNDTLENWMTKLYDVFSYGFMMSGAKNWGEFKNNIRYIRVQ